jgi:sec-independent protein translocase protein TatC
MTVLDDRPDAFAESRMTIWEHLAELRSRLVKCALALAVGVIIGFFLYPYVVTFLKQPYLDVDPNAKLVATALTEGFKVRMETSLYLGVAIAMPVLLWQLWRFVTPGLYPHEKRYAIPFTASALLLFALGAAIAYLSLAPTIQFLTGIAGEDIEQLTGIESYLKLNLFMMLAFGAGFEFPVLLVALMLVGVLHPRQLLRWWRYAIVIIAVVAAVITPSGDPISMLALAVPMAMLYFVAIGIGGLIAWRRGRRVRPDHG